MKRPIFMPRILAFWLSLGLILPNSGFCMRPMSSEGAGLEQLRDQLLSVPGSEYGFVRHADFPPDLKAAMLASNKWQEYSQRLVEDSKGRHYLIKTTQFQSITKTLSGWHTTKNDPVRELIACRVAREMGVNVADVLIPERAERERLARALGSAIEADSLYLVRLTSDYKLEDEEVEQKDPKAAFVFSFINAFWIRKWDFYRGNEGPLKDSTDVTMTFDNDQVFNDHHVEVDTYADNFILNFFSEARALGSFQVTTPNELLRRLDLEEIAEALHRLEQVELEPLQREIEAELITLYGLSEGAAERRLRKLFVYLHERRRQIRRDLADFFEILYSRDASVEEPVISSDQIRLAIGETEMTLSNGTLTPPRLYDEALKDAGVASESRRLFDEDSTSTPAEYLTVPPEGVLIPFPHLSLQLGFRVLEHSSAGQWYLLVRVAEGEEQLQCEVRRSDRLPRHAPIENGLQSPQSQHFRGISIETVPEGVVVRPAGPGRVLIERFPGEMTLTIDEEARLGELIQREHEQVRAQGVKDIGELLQGDPYQPVEVINHPAIRITRSVVQEDRASLSVRIAAGRVAESEVEMLLGSYESMSLTTPLIMKLTDGALVGRVSFLPVRGGPLFLNSARLPLNELEPMKRLLMRLAVKLSLPQGRRNYQSLEGVSLSDLVKGVIANSEQLGEGYRRRHLASIALVYRKDFGAVRFLLRRLRKDSINGEFVEPADTLRRDIISHLYWRHHKGTEELKFDEAQRVEVRDALANLLTGPGADPSPFVRIAAAQTLTRLTPKLDVVEIYSSLTTLATVAEQDPNPDVAEKAWELMTVLENQRTYGAGAPIRLQTGPSVRKRMVQSGLEQVEIYRVGIEGAVQAAREAEASRDLST